MPGVLSKVLVPAGEWPSSKKRKGLNALSDLAVWGCPDNDIIDAADESWRSTAYGHYNVEVCRVYNNLTDPPVPYEIVFKFSCKYHHPDHAPHYRSRTKTGDGTTKLRKGAEKCSQRHLGHSADDTATSEVVVPPYSEAKHRAILALWSAHSHRSFASLTDKFHRMEVEYLRPGTTLPSSSTISRDVKTIYAKYAPRVREYFLSVNSAVHLAIDGWTSPISESYLGIIAVWFDKLEIHRCILEFVRLTSSHTGEYLADRVASCIRRYALEDKILAAALDNASNNLTLVRHLQQHIPSFLGERSYVRCLAHILNLMAKAFMLPYSRPSKRTKQVLARTATDVAAIPSSSPVQEFILAQQLDALPESDELEAPNSAEVDEGEFEHDTLVAQASVVKAIEQLYGIMPKVASLARRVDESTALTIKFHEAISLFPALKESGRKALSRRVPTRWGSDRHALDDHIHLRQPVQWITGQVPELKLQSLALNEDQWPLAEELNEALEVFEVPTKRFSAGSVPLVHDVLPKLIELKETLETIRASPDISPVTRVGAQAALNVFDKYLNNMSICEVYFISLDYIDVTY
ncbi:hypothetical protein FRC06_007593 [Ceratobasidium sp. 370]|nr:hypothetical protein FRC06_007593 [Ceratobasidium sp. 370]